MMDDAEIDALYKIDGTRRIPLLGNTPTKLRKLLDFVDENRVNNVPDCFITSTYNPENLKEYYRLHRTVSVIPPSSQSSNHNAKSPAEQKLQDWNRGKRSKTDFEVLKEDQNHDSWAIPFKGEIVQQGLDVMIDPKYDPFTNIKPGSEQELFDLQCKCFWTVVLYVLQNPFGKTCVSEYYATMNGRAAFQKHRTM